MSKVRWRIHPLFFLLLAAMTWAGYGREVLQVVIALLAHESAHLAVARSFHLPVASLEIMPYGGVIRIESLDQTDPAKEILVAAAGPAANFLLLATGFLLLPVLQLEEGIATFWLSLNAGLASVNLLPAMPLDGGRIARGILASRYGHQASLLILFRMGRIASCLFVMAGIILLMAGKPNWMMPLLGVFLWLRTGERGEGSFRAMRDLWKKGELLHRHEALEVRHLIVPADLPLNQLYMKFLPEQYHMILVTDDSMYVQAAVEEEAVLQALVQGRGEEPVSVLAKPG